MVHLAMVVAVLDRLEVDVAVVAVVGAKVVVVALAVVVTVVVVVVVVLVQVVMVGDDQGHLQMPLAAALWHVMPCFHSVIFIAL